MGMVSEYDERMPADDIDVDISNIPHYSRAAQRAYNEESPRIEQSF